MSNALPGLRRERTAASGRMTKLAATARGRSMTDDEQHDFDAAANEVASLDERIAAAERDEPEAKGKTVGRAEAAEIVKLCVDGGLPMMASSMIAEGIGVEDAKARIAAAGKAQDLVALARRKDASIPADLAATMLAEGKTIDEMRAILLDKLVASEEKTSISSHVSAAGDPSKGAPKPVDLVADMKRRHGVKA